jgi:hypothetical protein
LQLLARLSPALFLKGLSIILRLSAMGGMVGFESSCELTLPAISEFRLV